MDPNSTVQTSTPTPVRNVIISPAPPDKPFILAVAQVELGLDDHAITVDDVRVLRNRQGELWVSLPTRSVRSVSSSREYQYVPVIILSRVLKRLVEDAVLAAYERWGIGADGAAVR